MAISIAASVLEELDSLDRKRTEALYASSVAAAQSGYSHLAKGLGEECIVALRKRHATTREETATHQACVGGIAMPEFLHEDVVRQRLGTFNIGPEC
jgi:hypothetical protein